MIDDIYEVTKDEYNSLVKELKNNVYEKIVKNYDTYFTVDIYSKDMKRHFTSLIYTGDYNLATVKYYIIDLPLPEERNKSMPVKQITINDEEDAQKLLNLIFNMSANKDNERIIS